jgi:predicted protein tyrosine phosphatase
MIHVCPLHRVHDLAEEHGVSHVMTLISAGTEVATPQGIEADRHLKLFMHDIIDDMEGMTPPAQHQVERLVAFALNWDSGAPMLIHCWAGISRSTAAAFVSLCALNPAAEEATIARALREASPTATPNQRIVALADQHLGRQGRMVRAIAAIGRGQSALEGRPFVLPGVF